MSIVPRLFNSSRFVRAINLSCFKSSVNAKYLTFPSNFGYVSIGKATNQLPTLTQSVCAQRFYSDKADESQTQKSAQYDESGAEIIYTGKFQTKIIRVKLFSFSTSLMGLAAQPILLEKGMEMGGKGLAAFLCTLAGIFTFVTPVLLHYVTKKYVIKITHNPKTDEYEATLVSFFLMKNLIKFKVEDIIIPEVDTMFTTFQVGPKKIPMLVEPTDFTDTHHFARFMQYDKPIKFELNAEEERILAQKTKELTNK